MADALLPKPWRKSKYLELPNKQTRKQRVKDDIINYKPLHDLLPPLHRFPQVNIMLFGPVGAGKSSVFNTISSVFKGKNFNIARCGRAANSVTTKLTKFQVMYGGIAEQLRLTLWDTRGIEAGHLMTSDNMRYLLQGRLPDRYQMDPSGEIDSQSNLLVNKPKLQDLVHCVATVIDVSTIDDMGDEVLNNITQMHQVMNNTDVPHVILLTHIDKVCAATAKDATNAYRSTRIKAAVDRISELLGVPRNGIFFMKCYEDECNLDINVDITALITLKSILDYCDAYLYRVYDDVTDIASERGSIEDENKTLKDENKELSVIAQKLQNQLNMDEAKLKSLRAKHDAMKITANQKPDIVAIQKEYELLKREKNLKETEIARLKEERNELHEEVFPKF